MYYSFNRIFILLPILVSCITAGASSRKDGVLPSGTLPLLHINVYMTDSNGDKMVGNDGNPVFNDEIIDYNLGHKNYFKGEYWLDINGCRWLEDLGASSIASEGEPLPLEIKARGNWTRTGFSKKPFKIKLGKKQDLLSLTPEKSKHYALLAHADDWFGYLRNFTGFNLGHRIGLPWTPGMQPVELIVNGDYRGIYFLTESIRVGDGRIEIEELDDLEQDGSLISGGYVVELDNYDEDNQIRLTEKSCVSGHNLDKLRITWDTPEEYSDIQKRFVTEQFSAMNDCVGNNDDALWSYLDLDDAVRYYLAREIVSDTEAYHGSTYLFRQRGEGEKWHFSPIWDCGQSFNGSTTKFFYDNDPYGNTWIPSIRTNSRFNEKLKETWKWFMSERYDGLLDDIDEFVTRIKEGAKADRNRWKDAPTPNGGSGVADNSNIGERKSAVVRHLKEKTEWLTQKFGSFAGSHPEPVRDDTPAASLPDYARPSGIDEIIGEVLDDSFVPEFFNLQGMKIKSPQKGETVIMRQGSHTSKIIFK